ncbi:MAG: hypothetical protein WBQ18_04560 [Solirubrobacteraceae bacterium]
MPAAPSIQLRQMLSDTHDPLTDPMLGSSVPATPPEDVWAEIGVAAEVFDALESSGRHVHFGRDPRTGTLRSSLQDAEGNLLAALSPRQVIELACGAGPHTGI